MNHDLSDVWEQQLEYNKKIQTLETRTRAEWMTNYILGVMGELGELLEEIKWKSHRSNTMPDFGPNVEEEMSDITKYVISMWQLLGATQQDMTNAMYQKGEMLEQLLRQEIQPSHFGRCIIMLDLDGVVADFRDGFKEWLETSKWQDSLQMQDDQIGLHLDINNGWDYSAYEEAKIAFEQDGGYDRLPCMQNICLAVNLLGHLGWYVIVYTARPYKTYRRIWRDTWQWLSRNNVRIDELHFGYSERVLAAQRLRKDNLVIAFEDDPILLQRYNGAKIPVYRVPQPYNLDMRGAYINKISPEMSPMDITLSVQENQYLVQGR